MSAPFSSAVLWLAAGALVGALYWMSLGCTVAILAAGRSWGLAIALQVARFAILGALLTVVAIHWGAIALLVSAGGLMLVRAIALRLAARG